MSELIFKKISEVYTRLMHTVMWGKSTAPSNETAGVATVQCSYMNGSQIGNDNHMQMYGFASATLAGCDHVRVSHAGDNSKAVIIASNDNRYRPVGMLAGESQVYDNVSQSIKLSQAEGGPGILSTATNFYTVNVGGTNGASFSITPTTITLSIGGNVIQQWTTSGSALTGTATATVDFIANGISEVNHTHPYIPGSGTQTETGKGQG